MRSIIAKINGWRP